jgi:hypothetical protein
LIPRWDYGFKKSSTCVENPINVATIIAKATRMKINKNARTIFSIINLNADITTTISKVRSTVAYYNAGIPYEKRAPEALFSPTVSSKLIT